MTQKSDAITKVQAIIIIAVIAIAAIIGAYYYWSSTTTTPPAEKVLVIGTTIDTENIEPAGNGEWWDMMVGCMVGEHLFEYREVSANNWQLLPLLGESYTYSNDGSYVTIAVKQGLEFTDGTPFNASVVKYCWDRVLKINAPVGIFLMNIKNITLINDYELQVNLKTPDFTFMTNTPIYYGPVIYSPSAVKDYNVSTQSDYVGTGPFKLVSFAKGEQLILEANKDYWGEPKPKLDKIVVRWYGDSATLRMALESGAVDMAYKDLSPQDIQAVRQKSDIVVANNTGTSNNLYLMFNLAREPLDNPLVRKAIAYAIDYDYITNNIALGGGKRMLSMVPSFMTQYSKPLMEDVQRNVTYAKELLAQAGYSNGFTTSLMIAPGHGFANDDLIAVAIQANLEDIDINLEIETVDVATSFAKVFGTGDYDIAWESWFPDTVDPDNVLHAIIASPDAGGLFVHNYKNVQINQLLTDGLRTQNVTERKEIYDEIQQLWFEDLPTIPIMESYRCVAYRTYLKGWTQNGIIFTEVRQSFANCTVEK